MILSEAKQEEWEKPTVGIHPAVCVDVIELGPKTSTYEGKTRTTNEIKVVFRIGDQDTKDGDPIYLGAWFNATLHPMGKFREALIEWRGQDLSNEEKSNFNTEQLVGAQASVNVIEKKKQDGSGVSIRISSIMPPAKGQDVKVPDEYERVTADPDW